MKYAVIYWTRHGNNKKIVDTLLEKLKAKGDVGVFLTSDVDPLKMPVADRYVFSCATETLSIQKNMRKLMNNIQGMDGKEYALINTHAMDRTWLSKMEKILSNKKKMVKIAETDFQIGTEKNEDGSNLKEGWEARLDEFVGKI